jgi:hypothetical protein
MKTHWKKLTNPLYLGAYDFEQGEERTLIMREVKREQVAGPDGKKEECTIIFFESGKPMICNTTNAKAITKAHKTPYIEEWNGKAITVYVASVKAFGEVVDALRIKPIAPGKPALTQAMPQFNEAVKYMQGGGDIANIKAKYTLTSDVEQLLLK